MKAIIACLLALTANAALALSYSFDDLRKGIPEVVAVESARREGLTVSAHPQGEGHFLADATTHEIVTILWVCSGRVYGYSESSKGGAAGFVKRVAQLNAEFRKLGSAAATSKMKSFGEENTIEITWQDGWRAATVVYTPGGPGLGESQWVRYGVPEVCTR